MALWRWLGVACLMGLLLSSSARAATPSLVAQDEGGSNDSPITVQGGDVEGLSKGHRLSVNAATGNLVVKHTDLVIPAKGRDIVIERTYNSREAMFGVEEGIEIVRESAADSNYGRIRVTKGVIWINGERLVLEEDALYEWELEQGGPANLTIVNNGGKALVLPVWPSPPLFPPGAPVPTLNDFPTSDRFTIFENGVDRCTGFRTGIVSGCWFNLGGDGEQQWYQMSPGAVRILDRSYSVTAAGPISAGPGNFFFLAPGAGDTAELHWATTRPDFSSYPSGYLLLGETFPGGLHRTRRLFSPPFPHVAQLSRNGAWRFNFESYATRVRDMDGTTFPVLKEKVNVREGDGSQVKGECNALTGIPGLTWADPGTQFTVNTTKKEFLSLTHLVDSTSAFACSDFPSYVLSPIATINNQPTRVTKLDLKGGASVYRGFLSVNGIYPGGEFIRDIAVLTETSDPNGNRIVYEWADGPNGRFCGFDGTIVPRDYRLVRIYDDSNDADSNPDSVIVWFAYNTSGYISSIAVTDPVGNNRQVVAEYRHDGDGDLIGFTDIHGRAFSYTYAPSPDGDAEKLVGITDPEGGVAAISYHPDHKVWRVRSPAYSGGVPGRILDPIEPIPVRQGEVGDNLNADYYYSWPLRKTEEVVLQTGTARALAAHSVNAYTWEAGVEPETSGVLIDRRMVARQVYPYEAYNLLTHQPVAGAPVTSEVWDYNDTTIMVTKETDGLGHSVFNTYDSYRLLTRKDYLVQGGTDYEAYTYNASHDLATSRDRNGNVRSFTYGDTNNPHLVTGISFRVDGTAYSEAITYWPEGLVQTVTKPDGSWETSHYDAQGSLVQKDFPRTIWNGGSPSTLTAHEYWEREQFFGRPDSRTDAAGHVVSYEYYPNRLPQSRSEQVETSGGLQTRTERYFYDLLGNLEEVEDYGGKLTHYDYDGDGRVTAVKKEVAGGWQETGAYLYESTGKMVRSQDGEGHLTEITRNPAGWATRVRQKAVSTSAGIMDLDTSLAYDAGGNLLTKTMPGYVSSHWSYGYDPHDRLISVTEPGVSTSATYSYDLNGNLASFVDPSSRRVDFFYNELNQVAAVARSGRPVERTHYDGLGRVERDWEEGGVLPPPTTVHTAGGSNSTAADCSVGKTATFPSYQRDLARYIFPGTYKVFNQVKVYVAERVSSPTGNWTISLQTDAGGKPSGTYLKRGNGTNAVVTVTGPTSTGWKTFDIGGGSNVAVSRPFWVVFDAADQSTSRYWKFGKATTSEAGAACFRNGTGAWSVSGYSVGIELLGPGLPDAGSNRNAYNPDGSLFTRTLADGQVLRYGYDIRGNEVIASRDDGAECVTTTSSYFPQSCWLASRSQVVSGGPARTLAFGYDLMGKVVHVEYPEVVAGFPFGVDYQYSQDAFHRLVGIPGYLDGVTYDLNGRVVEVSFPNGMKESTARDELGRPTNLLMADTSEPGNPLTRLLESYAWEPKGNLAGKVRTPVGSDGTLGSPVPQTFGYDSNYRLTSSFDPVDGDEGFLRDAAGNRLNDGVGGARSDYLAYDASNRLTRAGYPEGSHQELSWVGPDGRSRGNLVRKTLVDSLGNPVSTLAEYGWSEDNLLKSAALLGKTPVSYVYDAGGTRVKRTAGGSSTRYLFLGLEALLEEKPDGSAEYFVVGLGGRHLAKVAVASGGSMETSFLHADYLKSVRLVTDVTGAVVWQERTRAFGSEAEKLASEPNDYRWTGKPWDEEAGLYYFNARWYDPALERFISEDPLWGNIRDPQSLNRFAYGRNNPFRYADPTGMSTEDCEMAGVDGQAGGGGEVTPGPIDADSTPAGGEDDSASPPDPNTPNPERQKKESKSSINPASCHTPDPDVPTISTTPPASPGKVGAHNAPQNELQRSVMKGLARATTMGGNGALAGLKEGIPTAIAFGVTGVAVGFSIGMLEDQVMDLLGIHDAVSNVMEDFQSD